HRLRAPRACGAAGPVVCRRGLPRPPRFLIGSPVNDEEGPAPHGPGPSQHGRARLAKNSTEGRIDGVRELRQNREEQSERPLQRAIDEQGLGARPRSIISAYIALTKPRVIELLLVTTAPVMFLAAHGLPNIWLVIN